jgi:arylsulfatase A-like enzyme
VNEHPNVIILVTDTFRPDHLGINGHPYTRTPELDAWLRRCVTFDNASASSLPTIPMRTDWFTGRFSHPRHGWKELERGAITLPGILGKNGYTTQLLASTTHMMGTRFWEPFHHFHFLRGLEYDVPLARLNDPVKAVVSNPNKVRVDYQYRFKHPLSDTAFHTHHRSRYEDEMQISKLVDAACRWIEDNYRGGPFMLWMDSFDVHEPWFPPEFLWRMYQPEYDGEPMIQPNYHSASVYSPQELKNMQARYAAMCTLASKQLGRLLRTIEDSGLLQNSIVCFLSDHGMYLGERGRTGKALIKPDAADCFPFHCELTRICWTMHIPPSLGIKSASPGSRLKPVIQAPDLLPTILELCGVSAPKEAQVEGVSLVPWLKNERNDQPREISIATSTTGTSKGFFKCRRPTITDGEWTLLLTEPPDAEAPKLYHVAADPRQERDVFSSHREEARRLHAKMLEWLRAREVENGVLERLSAANSGL